MTSEIQEPQIGVTGSYWVGRGKRSIWSLVRDSFAEAEREIIMAAYSLSETSPEFIGLFDTCLRKGVRIVLIVNRFGEQPSNARKGLVSLAWEHQKRLVLKNFNPTDRREDLHAKLIVIDHRIALVGSANITWKGMNINHELVLRIAGRRASEVGDLLDKLSVSPDTKLVRVEGPAKHHD